MTYTPDPAELAWSLGITAEEPPPRSDRPGRAGTLFTGRTLAAVEPERVEWLWPDRLPKGKLVMVDGDPGVSKSTLSITCAAHLSTGTDWPDGSPCPLGDVLLLTAEDGIGDTVRPRLDAAGGDPRRVHVLDQVTGGADDGGEPIHRPPTLADVLQLEAAIRHYGAVLCIVDVLMAYLPGGTDSHRDQDVRAVLSRIKDVADRTGCAFLFVRHLNKSGGAAIYRGGGSIGISGAARVAWMVGRDPEDEQLLVLAQTKNNLAPMPPALSYRLADRGGVGAVEWAGQVQRTADDLLRADSGEDRDERDALAMFIVDFLTDRGGQAPAKDCQRAVHAVFGPVARMTLKRARDRARVATRKGGMHTGWVWELPEGTTEGTEDTGSQNPGTYGTFAGPSQPVPGPPLDMFGDHAEEAGR